MRAEGSTQNRGVCLTAVPTPRVLNNNLFQVLQRSSQINFPSSWASYIFRTDMLHARRQVAVKGLQPAAVYWINGLSDVPLGVGRWRQLPKHWFQLHRKASWWPAFALLFQIAFLLQYPLTVFTLEFLHKSKIISNDSWANKPLTRNNAYWHFKKT